MGEINLEEPIIIDPYRNQPIAPLLNKPQVVRKGGKRYLSPVICELIDSLDYSMYVEPFFGGGRIYFEKQPHFEETINDREERIANFHYCASKFPEEMTSKQALLIKDENQFFRIYDKYWGDEPLNNRKKRKKTLQPIEVTELHDQYHEAESLSRVREEIRTGYELLEETPWLLDDEMKTNIIDVLVTHAIEFYFYSNMVFRGGDARTMTYFENDPRTEKNRLRYRIFRPLYWLGERMRRTQILNKDFQAVFKIVLKYANHTRIFFIDPPYWKVDGYEYPFPWENYVILNEILQNLPHSDYFILTLNDQPEFWTLFVWCKIEKKPTHYTTGGAGQKKDVWELMITPPWDPKKKNDIVESVKEKAVKDTPKKSNHQFRLTDFAKKSEGIPNGG